MRVPGLASGMDIDSMVKDMLVKERDKVDKAKQSQQVNKWKQEIYKDIIKDTKNLYDKYFSMTSSNSLLSSNNYSTVGISSSNSNVITATAGPGAEKVNYKFNITSTAQPPGISGKITDDQIKKLQGTEISIGEGSNIKNISIDSNINTVSDLINSINSQFSDGSVKASYSEMTGEFSISGNKTGKDSELSISGTFFTATDSSIAGNPSIITMKGKKDGIEFKGGKIIGSNLEGTVSDFNGNVLKSLDEKSNSFTIDNITYSANSVGESTLTGVTDTKKAVENMSMFIDDYNKLMDKMYTTITQKTPKDHPPLTDEQKKEMSEDEIKNWESKAKEGILRNDSEMRRFMDEIQSTIFGTLEGSGVSLAEMGIKSNSDYNKKNQLSFDPDTYSKTLEEKGDLVYSTLSKGVNGEKSLFDKLKDTFYKYGGSSTSIFASKAGMGAGSENNNTFSKEIKKQESNIKNLIQKMQAREKQLYSKFASLEASLNKYNSQMSYFMQTGGY